MDDLKLAHKHSRLNHDEILRSNQCGCYYCLEVFDPKRIVKWVEKGQTALCPECGIDSVIGSESGYSVDDEQFLKRMYDHWFGTMWAPDGKDGWKKEKYTPTVNKRATGEGGSMFCVS